MTTPKVKTYPVNTDDRIPKVIGTTILAVTFGLFGTWAATAPIDGAAVAPGTVTVESYKKVVQHLEGGIVSKIYVRDGDVVRSGQPLIEFDTTQAKAELAIINSQLDSLAVAKIRLSAERDNLTSMDTKGLESSDSESIQTIILNEKQLFKARLDTLAGKQEMISSYTDEITELEELLKDGIVDKQRIRDLKRKRNDLKNQISSYRADLIDQFTKTDAKITDLKERKTAIQDRLSRTLVTAPEDGKIMSLATHTIGAVIKSGEPLLEIIPENNLLIVEAKVSPVDIDRVAINDEAEIRFSAFKQGTTPVIPGKVTYLSADRLIDKQNGIPYYLAKLKLTQEGNTKLSQNNLTLIPGMPAETMIKTGERTLIQYLIQPATDGFARSFRED